MIYFPSYFPRAKVLWKYNNFGSHLWPKEHDVNLGQYITMLPTIAVDICIMHHAPTSTDIN